MKTRIFKFGALILLAQVLACSTTQVEPIAPLPPEPPAYTRVPHPLGLDQADLMAVFTERDAPDPETLRDCDSVIQKLKKKSQSKEEFTKGVNELVERDPVKYHWCFYGKAYLLEKDIKSQSYLDEKQKTVLEAYLILTPVARAFDVQFHDSRYLRWAVTRYRQLSETVFYRKVELSGDGAARLAGPQNPYAALRPAATIEPESTGGLKAKTVAEKYGLIEPTIVTPENESKPMPMPMPVNVPTRAPAKAAASPDDDLLDSGLPVKSKP